MTIFRIRLAVFAFCVLSLPSHGFTEIAIADGTFYASVFSKQKFADYGSPLNPEFIFYESEPYTGSEEYTFGYRLEKEKFALTMNDFGSILAQKNAELKNSVSELVVSVPLPFGFIDLGKKRICQSSSYFKSPINFIVETQRDMRFSEGRWMVNLDLFTGIGFFGFSYLPDIRFSKTARDYFSDSQREQYLFRYAKSAFGIDTTFALARDNVWKAGAQAVSTIGEYVELHGEYAFHERKGNTENCSEGLAGMTLNLKSMTGIFEYYYNQDGYDPKEWNAFLSSSKEARAFYDRNPDNPLALNSLGNAFQALNERGAFENSQQYIMLRISNPTTDTYQAVLQTVCSLQDFSGIAVPSLSYEGWDNITLSGSVSIPFGKKYSEFKLYGEYWNCSLDLELWL